MREISVADQRMNADGGDESGAAGQQDRLPQGGRWAPEPDTAKQEQATGSDSATKAGAIMSNEGEQTTVDRPQAACIEAEVPQILGNENAGHADQQNRCSAHQKTD